MNEVLVLGKFDIPFVDTHMQRVVDGKTYTIELLDTHAILQFKAHVEERDDEESPIWVARYQSLRQVVRREWIACVMLLFNNKCRLWQVQMDIRGSSNEIWFQYVEHKDAKEMYDRLEQYYLSTKL